MFRVGAGRPSVPSRFENRDITPEVGFKVAGNKILLGNDGWYEIQSAITYRTLYEGGRSAVVDPGVYNIINHTTGQRFENIVVSGTTSLRVSGESGTSRPKSADSGSQSNDGIDQSNSVAAQYGAGAPADFFNSQEPVDFSVNLSLTSMPPGVYSGEGGEQPINLWASVTASELGDRPLDGTLDVTVTPEADWGDVMIDAANTSATAGILATPAGPKTVAATVALMFASEMAKSVDVEYALAENPTENDNAGRDPEPGSFSKTWGLDSSPVSVSTDSHGVTTQSYPSGSVAVISRNPDGSVDIEISKPGITDSGKNGRVGVSIQQSADGVITGVERFSRESFDAPQPSTGVEKKEKSDSVDTDTNNPHPPVWGKPPEDDEPTPTQNPHPPEYEKPTSNPHPPIYDGGDGPADLEDTQTTVTSTLSEDSPTRNPHPPVYNSDGPSEPSDSPSGGQSNRSDEAPTRSPHP